MRPSSMPVNTVSPAGDSGSTGLHPVARLTKLERQALGQYQDADIVKKGHLHIKRPPTQTKLRLKAWQKRYFVLRDLKKEDVSTTCLEIYQNEHCARSSKRDKYTIDLKQVTDVDEYVDSRSFPHAFIISCKGKSPLVIGAGSDLEMREWLVAIKLLSRKCRGTQSAPSSRRQSTCSNSEISRLIDLPLPKSVFRKFSVECLAASPQRAHVSASAADTFQDGFLVQLQPTAASRKHGIAGGEYMMLLSSSHVILRAGETDALTWPLTEIRKFRSEEITTDTSHLVTLEASGNCGSAAGVYLFKTTYGRELIVKVRDAAKRLSLKRREQQEDLERLRLGVMPLDRASSVPCLVRSSPPKQEPSDTGYLLPVHSYLPILPDNNIEVDATVQASSPLHTIQGSSESEICRPRKDSGFDESFEENRHGARVRKAQSTPVPTPPPRPRHTLTSLSLPIPEQPRPSSLKEII